MKEWTAFGEKRWFAKEFINFCWTCIGEKPIFEVFHNYYPVWDKAGIKLNEENRMKTVIGSAESPTNVLSIAGTEHIYCVLKS